jgi:hypothetical protein
MGVWEWRGSEREDVGTGKGNGREDMGVGGGGGMWERYGDLLIINLNH